MSREITIEIIGRKINKQKIIRERARECLKGKWKITDLSRDLATQMYDDGPGLYLNPTERFVISDLIVPNEPFATVLGSGDFAIEAAFHGARDILTFDINSNQYYPAALKLKGLQNFSYDDYWNFFSNTDSSAWFSPEKYRELKRLAEQDTALYAFIDEIMKQREEESKVRRSFLNLGAHILEKEYGYKGTKGEDINEVLLDYIMTQMGYEPSTVFRTIAGMEMEKQAGTYVESSLSYQQAQSTIKRARIAFIKADLTRLRTVLMSSAYSKKIGDGFQSVYLSNIPEFINGEIFGRTVEEQLLPLLKNGGTIAYCCQGTSEKTLNMSQHDLNALRNNLNSMESSFEALQLQQLINSAYGLKMLRGISGVNVDFREVPTFCDANGLEGKDTFVYVKK